MAKSNYNWDDWKDYIKNVSKEDCLEHLKESIMDCNNCYDLSERPRWVVYGHAVVVLIVTLISVLENTLFFILISRHKKLQYRSSIIAIAVVFVNMGLIVTFHHPVFVSAASSKWNYSFTGCQIFGFLSHDFLLTYWLNMGILAIDKFCMTHFSFYPKRSKCFLILLIIASWIAPLLLSTITVDEFSIVVFRQNVPTCVPYFPKKSKGGILLFSMGIITALIGGVIPFIIYTWVYFKKYMKSCMKNFAGESGQVRNRPATSESHALNERVPGSNTLALIFVASCLTNLPSGSLVMVRWISQSAWCSIPHEIHFISVELLCSTSAIVPAIVMWEKDFRVELKWLLLCCLERPRSTSRSEGRNTGHSMAREQLQAFGAVYYLRAESRLQQSNGSNELRRSGSLPVLSPRKKINFQGEDDFLTLEETLNQRPQDTQCSSLNLSSSSYGMDQIEIRQI